MEKISKKTVRHFCLIKRLFNEENAVTTEGKRRLYIRE